MRRRANKFTFVLTSLFGLFVNLFVCLCRCSLLKKKKRTTQKTPVAWSLICYDEQANHNS